jgi:hypothetical protein
MRAFDGPGFLVLTTTLAEWRVEAVALPKRPRRR